MFRVQLFYRALKKGAEAMGGAVGNQKRVTMGGLNLIPHHNRTASVRVGFDCLLSKNNFCSEMS